VEEGREEGREGEREGGRKEGPGEYRRTEQLGEAIVAMGSGFGGEVSHEDKDQMREGFLRHGRFIALEEDLGGREGGREGGALVSIHALWWEGGRSQDATTLTLPPFLPGFIPHLKFFQGIGSIQVDVRQGY
jgi:hypothetical protein